MSIKENQLPIAEQVSTNNLIRTVSGDGNSENMTVEQLGNLVGSGLILLDCPIESIHESAHQMPYGHRKQGSVSFQSPIALSKIRAIWFRDTEEYIPWIELVNGNLQNDQVYQITVGFFSPLTSETTISKARLYVLLENGD